MFIANHIVDTKPGAETDHSQGTKTQEWALTRTHYKIKWEGLAFAPWAETMETRPTHNLLLLIQYWHGTNSSGYKTGRRSNQARQKLREGQAYPALCLTTTHFSSTANTILFVSVHYPQMLDRYRQNPSGGLDRSLSPTNKLTRDMPASEWKLVHFFKSQWTRQRRQNAIWQY